jgi:DNA-binding CsgD family transcriptional regulator
MLLTIVRLCGFEIKKAHVIVCVSLAALMFAMIATAGFLPWYYKSVALEPISGGVKLVKEYGPLHPVYMVYLLGYFAAMIATIVHSVRRKKMGDPKLAGFIAGVVCGNITVWLFEKFINWEFEFLSVTYLASELLLLLVYWMMQDYVHKSDLPSTQIPTGDTERARELARERGLTAKECEVLEMMLLGESRKQIAAELHVSENTVKTHVKHIYEKLGVGGREEIQALLS